MSKKLPTKNEEVIVALRKEVRRLKKKLTEKNKLIKTCQEELRVFRSQA
jgi:TRAP-type mannitol/chloroaromatic compound transport system substrate-binding protein